MGRRTNRDWAWDQFDLTKAGTELDIYNDEFLQELELTRDQKNWIETEFIDELYGTDDAQWTREGLPEDYGGRRYGGDGVLNTQMRGRSSYLSQDITTWGLDIRRVLNEDLNLSRTEHYEWLTRGTVDWAYYENEASYQRAYDVLSKDSDKSGGWGDYSWEELWDRDPGDHFQRGDQERVDFIRAANAWESLGAEGDPDKPWTDPNSRWYINPNFDNKYVAKYYHTGDKAGQPVDGSEIEPYKETPLFNPDDQDILDRIVDDQGNRMTLDTDIDSPDSIDGRRDIAGAAKDAGITIRSVNVRKPNNIPASWGSA